MRNGAGSTTFAWPNLDLSSPESPATPLTLMVSLVSPVPGRSEQARNPAGLQYSGLSGAGNNLRPGMSRKRPLACCVRKLSQVFELLMFFVRLYWSVLLLEEITEIHNESPWQAGLEALHRPWACRPRVSARFRALFGKIALDALLLPPRAATWKEYGAALRKLMQAQRFFQNACDLNTGKA